MVARVVRDTLEPRQGIHPATSQRLPSPSTPVKIQLTLRDSFPTRNPSTDNDAHRLATTKRGKNNAALRASTQHAVYISPVASNTQSLILKTARRPCFFCAQKLSRAFDDLADEPERIIRRIMFKSLVASDLNCMPHGLHAMQLIGCPVAQCDGLAAPPDKVVADRADDGDHILPRASFCTGSCPAPNPVRGPFMTLLFRAKLLCRISTIG